MQLTHANATAIVQINRDRFGLDSNTVDACYASFGFDACFNDIVSIPASGGTIHVISEEMRLNLTELDKYLIENKVTLAIMTTQVGRMWKIYSYKIHNSCIK